MNELLPGWGNHRSQDMGMQWLLYLLLMIGTLLAGGCADRPEQPPLVAEQELRLEGGSNFRDLGGYASRDGRHVKKGLVYRSGSLAQLTDTDLDRLAALKLHTVYDFRSPSEVKAAPDRLPPDSDIRSVPLPIGNPDFDVEELRRRVMSGDIDGIELPDSYADLMLAHGDTYRTLFDNLLDPERIPGLFHCTAGKDRTGMGAALLLTALGVPRETVMQDFMASNYYLHDHTERVVWRARFGSLFRVDGQRLRSIMSVHAVSMENAFAAVEAKYGSVDQYLEQVLGLDEERLERLRTLYLE